MANTGAIWQQSHEVKPYLRTGPPGGVCAGGSAGAPQCWGWLVPQWAAGNQHKQCQHLFISYTGQQKHTWYAPVCMENKRAAFCYIKTSTDALPKLKV